MSVLDWDKHKRADGSYDWAAIHRDEEERGERCRTCKGMVWPAKGYRARCYDCERVDGVATESVSHKARARCPSCRDTWNFWDDPPSGIDQEILCGGGRMGVICPRCDHRFPVEISVQVEIRSPACAPRDDGDEEATP